MLEQYPSLPLVIILIICVVVGVVTICTLLYLMFAVIRELNECHKERMEKDELRAKDERAGRYSPSNPYENPRTIRRGGFFVSIPMAFEKSSR